jgi:hypothetical protein
MGKYEGYIRKAGKAEKLDRVLRGEEEKPYQKREDHSISVYFQKHIYLTKGDKRRILHLLKKWFPGRVSSSGINRHLARRNKKARVYQLERVKEEYPEVTKAVVNQLIQNGVKRRSLRRRGMYAKK